MSESVPLNCLKCGHNWNYKGTALADPHKRIQCPKCKSIKIQDSLENKVNSGFKLRHQQTESTNQEQNQSLNQTNPNTQNSTTLDLSNAKKLLDKQIPTVDQLKNNIQTSTNKTPTKDNISTSTNIVTPELFSNNDFKIVYSLLDDFIVHITKNKGLEHSEARKREMSTLMSKMLNKYGLKGTMEFVFIFTHIAYVSPLFYYFYKGKRNSNKETDSNTTNKAENISETDNTVPKTSGALIFDESETKTVSQKNTKDKKGKLKKYNADFSSKSTMTIGDYLKK